MQALLQRVTEASVSIEGQVTARIGHGLLVLLCAEHGDSEEVEKKLLAKIVKLRIFSDTDGKMNRSVTDVSGSLLIVSQFTLAADTAKGNRPSFIRAARPEHAKASYDAFVSLARQTALTVATGEFAANMQVSLVNDGPVTIPMCVR
jgi:D-tyrosyl-tRNA(Tyr) deacylase